MFPCAMLSAHLGEIFRYSNCPVDKTATVYVWGYNLEIDSPVICEKEFVGVAWGMDFEQHLTFFRMVMVKIGIFNP